MARKYYYGIEYASSILRQKGLNSVEISSNKKLKEGQYIVVEHKDCGIFIGKVYEELKKEDCLFSSINEYEYVQNIDLTEWEDKKEREKRREELRRQMESKFSEIDKKKKYEYYAEIDEDFRNLYLEYESLN